MPQFNLTDGELELLKVLFAELEHHQTCASYNGLTVHANPSVTEAVLLAEAAWWRKAGASGEMPNPRVTTTGEIETDNSVIREYLEEKLDINKKDPPS